MYCHVCRTEQDDADYGDPLRFECRTCREAGRTHERRTPLADAELTGDDTIGQGQ